MNDIDWYKSAAVDKRIRALGGAAVCFNKPADEAIDHVLAAVNPSGLHFAFLDPYNLEYMPFRIIEKLAKLPRVDMLIHVSVQGTMNRGSMDHRTTGMGSGDGNGPNGAPGGSTSPSGGSSQYGGSAPGAANGR